MIEGGGSDYQGDAPAADKTEASVLGALEGRGGFKMEIGAVEAVSDFETGFHFIRK